MVGYVEGGRLVKIEGQPNSIRTGGKVCAKAHAGVGPFKVRLKLSNHFNSYQLYILFSVHDKRLGA
jgi:hypothetical protein